MSEVVTNVRHSADWSEVRTGWMAFRLEDGRSDGVVYDSRDDAIRHHWNRSDKYFYFSLKNAIGGLPPDHATMILATARVQSSRGRYHPVPENQDPIPRLTMEDYLDELYTTARRN